MGEAVCWLFDLAIRGGRLVILCGFPNKLINIRSSEIISSSVSNQAKDISFLLLLWLDFLLLFSNYRNDQCCSNAKF